MAVAAYNQVLTFWRDANQKVRTCAFTITDQSDAVTAPLIVLGTKLQALSNAKLFAVQLQTTHNIGGDPVDATYKSVYDIVTMQGKMADASSWPQYEIPCPKAAIFRADTLTLDMANVDVIAAAAQMVAVLGNAAGTSLGSIVRGARQYSGPP